MLASALGVAGRAARRSATCASCRRRAGIQTAPLRARPNISVDGSPRACSRQPRPVAPRKLRGIPFVASRC